MRGARFDSIHKPERDAGCPSKDDARAPDAPSRTAHRCGAVLAAALALSLLAGCAHAPAGAPPAAASDEDGPLAPDARGAERDRAATAPPSVDPEDGDALEISPGVPPEDADLRPDDDRPKGASGATARGARDAPTTALEEALAAVRADEPLTPSQREALERAGYHIDDEGELVDAEGNVIDRAHRAISGGLIATVNRVDRFFVEEYATENVNKSWIRLGPGVRVRDDGDVAFRPRLNANIALPNTEDRIGLVLAGGNDEDVNTDDTVSNDEDDGFAAGLRVYLLDRKRTKMNFGVGSRFRPEPDPFARFRIMRIERWRDLLIRPTQFLFWELEEGLGERTRLDFDHPVGDWSLLRLRNQATYTESTHGTELDGNIIYYFTLREDAGWQLRGRVKAETGGKTRVTEYRPSLRYRWSMFRKWLFFEIEPRFRWLREYDRDPVTNRKTSHEYNLTIETFFRVEAVFGVVKRTRRLKPLLDDDAPIDD